jgi:hypothetical protein
MTIDKTTAIAIVISLLIGVGLGAWGMHTWQVTDLQKALALEQAKPPEVKETVKSVTDTKLAYVPGQTVYLPSPASTTALTEPITKDTPGAVATKLDGKFDIGKPSFNYMVNGKVGKFDKTDNESYIFDKGMLDLKQSSTVTIQAEIPTIDLTRHNVLTGGVMYSEGKTSPALGYTGSVGKAGAYQLAGSKIGGYVGVGIKF